MSTSQKVYTPTANQILNALTRDEYEHLAFDLEYVGMSPPAA
jgi:hypothetical protein